MVVIVDLVVSFVEMFLLFWLLEDLYPLRLKSPWVRGGFLLAAALVCGGVNEAGIGYVGSLLCVVLCILYAAFVLQGSFARKLGTMAAYCVILVLIDFTTLLVGDIFLFHDITDSFLQNIYLNDQHRMILMLLSKFFLSLLTLIYIYHRKKSNGQLNNLRRIIGVWIATKEEMLAASLCFIMMFMVIKLLVYSETLEKRVCQYLLEITILIYGMYLLLALLIRKVNCVNERTNELRLKLQREQMTKKHYEECQIFLTELEELKNNMNQYFSDIENIIDEETYEDLQEYFDVMDARIDNCQVYLSGNETFDIIINQKISYAKAHHIHIQLDIQRFSIKQIADVDMVRLLSNVLDNAIEAVMQAEPKHIYFSLKRKGNYIIIVEENACSYVKVGKNGRLKTTKKNTGKHGMGLEIIEEIVHKYNGHCHTCWEKENFSLKLVLEDK